MERVESQINPDREAWFVAGGSGGGIGIDSAGHVWVQQAPMGPMAVQGTCEVVTFDEEIAPWFTDDAMKEIGYIFEEYSRSGKLPAEIYIDRA